MKKKKLSTRKNMHKSKKAQGNLESLILIGGAVLISVVIVYVLISMGGQGRDNASAQGDNISSSTDGPLPPTIVSVDAKYLDCYAVDPLLSTDKVGLITFSWKPLSKEGTFKLIIQNSSNEVLGDYDYVVSNEGVLLDSKDLNPNILNNIVVSDIPLGEGACGDTYYLSIEVSKNSQSKTSSRFAFRWSEQGEKTTLVSRPLLSPPAGVYNIENFPLPVTIVSDPSFAVYYTLDGTDPSVSATRILYNGSSLSMSPGDTIKAVSEYGGIYSGVLTGTFTDSYYTVSSVEATPGSQINLIDPLSVSLATSTPSSTIYYTLDGTTPDCSGSFTEYTSPITGVVDTTIKAIACRNNYLDSSVSTFTYTFFEPLDAVLISPPTGSYTSVQNVTLSHTNVGATIRYTTTGVDPTITSPIYSGPITVSSTSTVKAIAFVDLFYSPISQADYNITLPAIAPTFNPVPGNYTNNQSILITSTTPIPNTIKYTLDGTDPDENSSTYVGGVTLTQNQTLKARVYKTGWSASPVTTGVYNFALSAPTFSPVAGAYSDSQDINIISVAGAQISYTLNGSAPVQGGPNIINSGESVNISSSKTIKAIAYKAGWSSSPVASGNYTINEPAASPVFSPDGGTHTNSVNVTLSCATPSSTIRYTTDGVTDPTRTTGTVYSTPLNFTSTTTVKAVCYANGYSTSPVITKTFTIQYIASPVTLSPTGGNFSTNQVVTLSTTTPLPYTIRYTTDGTDPTPSSASYISAIPVTQNQTLKARVYKSGYQESAVTSGVYNFALLAPTFNPTAPSNHEDSVSVIINSVAGAQISYTLNGSAPVQGGPNIINSGESVLISSTATLRAIAYKSGWSSSPVAQGTYTINAPAASPVFSPDGGTHSNSVNVALSCTTPSSTIRYTTDGVTDPTRTTGTVYSTSLNFTSTTTVKAVCYANGYSTSSVITKIFTVEYIASPVTLSPTGGNFSTNQVVTLSTTTPLPYTIRYTTDGTDPTPSSASYISAIPVTQNQTLKARVYKSGYQESAVTSGVYNFALLAPTFNPTAPSNHEDSVSVIINSVAGAQISYTLNGSNPVQGGPNIINSGESTAPITSTSVLKAIAYKSGWSSSPVAQGTYTINAPASTPTFSPNGGTHTNSVNVTLNCLTPSSTIRYTTDGVTDPTRTTGTVYSSTLNFTSTTTVKAVCYANGYSTSSVATQTFTIVNPPAAVTVSGGGTYCSSATLTASGGAGGLIYYQGTTSNGTSTTNQTSTANITSSGTYYFRAYSSATALWGTQGSAAVTINTSSTAPTSVTGTNAICSGGSTTLTATGGTLGTGAAYQWYAGGCGSGSVLGTSSSLTVSPASTTTYYARLSGTCNTTTCASRTVTVSSPPVITATPASRCGTGTVTLGATTTSGTIEWYSASTGGTLLGTGNSFTTPSLSSTTTYYAGVTGGTCTLTTRTPVTATINALPTAVTATQTGSGPGYANLAASGGTGGTIYFQDTTSNGTSTSLGGTPQTVTSNGTYYFRSRSTAGCWGTQGSVVANIPAGLSNLVLSNNPSGFSFSSGTYTYNNILYLISTTNSITVTPTGSGTITVNGSTVASGSASSPISISDGNEKTITVQVTQGASSATYTLNVRKIITSHTGTATVTEGISGGYAWRVHKFTSGTGTYTSNMALTAQLLVVGGGGGGGGYNGNGGNAGTLRAVSISVAAGTTNWSVGAGGAGGSYNATGSTGGSSSFGATTSAGGAGGTSSTNYACPPQNRGGNGAGGNGSCYASPPGYGVGGAGLSNNITGTSLIYAAGGHSRESGGVAGPPNTGNGGAGKAAGSGTMGTSGGSGVVIVRVQIPV